jgi:hypothetical protein
MKSPPHWRRELIFHESAHAVAAYLQGLKIAKMEVWDHDGVTKIDDDARPQALEDPYPHAIVLLAGHAYMAGAGLPDEHSGSTDTTKAAILVDIACGPGRRCTAAQAFGVVSEAARKMVGTERFICLHAALVQHIDASGKHWHWGPDIERFLRDHDPERGAHAARRQVETHGRSDDPPGTPWYEVTDRNQRDELVYQGPDHAAAQATLERTPGGLLIGSEWWTA